MNYIQQITKVRSRGQMTVPKDVRNALDWPNSEVFVKIETTPNDGFKVERLPLSHPLTPKRKLTKKETEELWQRMKEISSQGKEGVNLTEFLRKDRDAHF